MAMLLTTKNWIVHWDISLHQFEQIISDSEIQIFNDSFLVVKARDYRTLNYLDQMIDTNPVSLFRSVYFGTIWVFDDPG